MVNKKGKGAQREGDEREMKTGLSRTSCFGLLQGDESLVMVANVDFKRCASFFPSEIFYGKCGLNVD